MLVGNTFVLIVDLSYYWTCHVNRSEDEERGCDWFEWAEMDPSGENIHPLHNKKRTPTL